MPILTIITPNSTTISYLIVKFNALVFLLLGRLCHKEGTLPRVPLIEPHMIQHSKNE